MKNPEPIPSEIFDSTMWIKIIISGTSYDISGEHKMYKCTQFRINVNNDMGKQDQRNNTNIQSFYLLFIWNCIFAPLSILVTPPNIQWEKKAMWKWRLCIAPESADDNESYICCSEKEKRS